MVPAVLGFMLVSAVSTPTIDAVTSESSVSVRRLRVIVRLDADSATKGIEMTHVFDEVRAIWKPYADVDFAGAADPRVSGSDADLRLVITDRMGPGSSDGSALAWITFVAPGRPANTMTASVAAVRILMGERWRERRIVELPVRFQRQFVVHGLSRSIAHEIGHYLLRSTAHASRGLMRPQLTVSDIMENALDLFRLEPAEIDQLKRRTELG